jgi:FecR protein
LCSLLAICRLSAILAVNLLGAGIALAETTTVGAVDKVQAHVDATQAGQTRALVVNSDVYFRDRCHSGKDARLQATLKDGTQLTLGENATLVVDEFVYDPNRSLGELSIRVVRGAFLYTGGLIEKELGAKVEIRAPIGAIGLRGTTVWGGPIDTVTLKQGQGTMIFGDGKPRRAAPWPASRMKRAVASITFGSLPGR